jgi:MHS family proline/betaine transporter-like MFS transporter
MVERARPERRGLVGAVADLGAVAGILAGSASGALLESLLSQESLHAWGWRVPFWIGLGVGLTGLALRRGLQEEPAAAQKHASPLLASFRDHWRVLLRLACLSAFSAVGFYLMFVYIVSWLQFTKGVPAAEALVINTVSMALLLPVETGMAWLSDRIGRRAVMLGATGFAVVAAWPLFWLMHSGSVAWMLAGQFGFVLSVGAFLGCLPTLMVEVVPRAVRCTAIALGYNVTLGIVGGLSPLVATWLVERTGNDYSPAFMIMIAAVISFGALLGVRVDQKAPLD